MKTRVETRRGAPSAILSGMNSRCDARLLSFVILLGCAGVGFAAIFLNIGSGPMDLSGLDYRVYITAGKMALNGVGAKFYDLPTQFAVQRELFPAMTQQDQLLPYLAPPFVSLLFAPLALLPLFPGYVVLTAFNVGLLWFIARAVIEELRLEGRARLVALLLLLTFAPILFTLLQGQVSLLISLAFLQSYRAAKAGRDFPAGIWFSLFLIRPQLALAPLLIFALKGRWKLLGGFALGALVLGGISLLLVGFEGLANYKTLLGAASGWERIYGVKPQQMQTWRGFVHALLGTDNGALVRAPWLFGVVAALGALLWSWRGAWEKAAPRFERQWAIMGIVALFCCPYLYAHDLGLLSVCGFLIFRAAQIEKSRVGILTFIGYGAVALWAALMATGATFPSLAVGFEAFAMLFLSASDRNPAATQGQIEGETASLIA